MADLYFIPLKQNPLTIFIGNLSQTVAESEVTSLFSQYGNVTLVNLVYDRYTHRSRGFGYVEMKNPGDGENAIQMLNNTLVGGRSVVVNEVRDGGAKGQLT